MSAPTPRFSHMFVPADGPMAEFLCHVELFGLTAVRAEFLHALHDDHPRDDCLVVTATELYLP
ncbi:hypothetical protein ACFXHA_45410 [Nocardia sp. NPDC059240]|uniref:hypothetical protein n=1 Tax=Nocardia sp. NPDC059240 TaxID=3346786 RepID=UPI0036BFA7E7